MEQQANLKVNYIYSLIYQILSIVIPLVTTPYISRVLEPDAIGIYSFVNANTVYFVLFGVLGLSTYSQLEVAKRRDDKNELSQFCIESMVTRFMTMGISILIYVIIYLILGQAKYKLYYLVQLMVLLANLIDVTWLCQGLENFKIVAVRNSIVRLVSLICVFVFVKTKEDLIYYFIINAGSLLISNLLVLPFVRQQISFDVIEKIHIVQHIKSTGIFFLPTIAAVIISTVDKLMIGWYTDGKEQNGYYEQAHNIINACFILFSSLNLSMRPRMAYLYKIKKTDEIKRIMMKSVSFFIFLSTPTVVGLFSTADYFVPWFFGKSYEPVVGLLKIMSWWIIVKAISNCMLEQSIVPRGGQITATKIIWTGAVVNVILNMCLIPKMQAEGAAIASLMTEILILLLSYYQTYSEININFLIKNIVKEIIAVLVMYSCVIFAKRFVNATITGIFVLIIIGFLSYVISLIVLKDDNFILNAREIGEKILRKEGGK